MVNSYIIKILANFINAVTLVYFFSKVTPPKEKKYSKFYGILMIIFYVLISSNIINNIIVYNFQKNKIFSFVFIYYILVLIYPIFFRIGSIEEKLFLSSLYITIMLVSSLIVYLIASQIFNLNLAEIIFYNDYRGYIVMLAYRFFEWILIYIFFYNRNFIKYIKDKTLYVGVVILILNQMLLFVIESDLLNSSNKINLDVIYIILALCAIQILSIYMLNIFSKEVDEKFILKMELNRKVYDEEIINMYKEMNGWKHDFRNHINMILGLLQTSSKEDAISYIDEINMSISKLDKNIYTDHTAINSILISKLKVAKEKNIDVSLDLKIDTKIKISNVDICTILGNLLDNSIEACTLIKGYKFINLKITSRNSSLIITISNNTNGYVNEVNGKFFTTKNNPISGIGLIQVDNVIKKYNGYINRKHENNIFITYIMI